MPMFETDTAVHCLDDDHFAATITDRWNGLAGRPLGGYVLAVGLRALQAAMPFPDLLVASGFFMRPVDPGSVDIRTELARTGKSSASGEVRLCQGGREALRCVATFADLDAADGQQLALAGPPDLPTPEDTFDLFEGGQPPAASIADRVEYRVADALQGRQQRQGRRPATTLWIRLREGGGHDTLAVPFLVDAAPPAVIEIGATGSTTFQLTTHVRARPHSGWFACRATTAFITDGYHEEDVELWDEEGRLLAQSRQLARLPRADTLAI